VKNKFFSVIKNKKNETTFLSLIVFGLQSKRYEQEGQHPLTGQRTADFRRDLEAT